MDHTGHGDYIDSSIWLEVRELREKINMLSSLVEALIEVSQVDKRKVVGLAAEKFVESKNKLDRKE